MCVYEWMDRKLGCRFDKAADWLYRRGISYGRQMGLYLAFSGVAIFVLMGIVPLLLVAH